MSEEHRKRAIEWYLYLRSEHPLPPAKLIQARHYQPAKTRTTAPIEQNPGPSSTAPASAPMKAFGTAQAGQDAHDTPRIYTRLSYNPLRTRGWLRRKAPVPKN
jgi:hypothetical protein